MDSPILQMAISLVANHTADGTALATKRAQLARRYLAAAVTAARASADLLESIASETPTEADEWARVPTPRPLSLAQLKAVWVGVNEQAQRILWAIATHGGSATPQDLTRALNLEEPRLLNGPLGGISRRVKKLLSDPEATFYSVHPDDGRYILPESTFESLCDLIEQERPEWLAESQSRTATKLPRSTDERLE